MLARMPMLLLMVLMLLAQDCMAAGLQGAALSTRIVQTKHGKLQGVVLAADGRRPWPRSVEMFLGVPYATPPVGHNRFAPTRAPSPWDGVRVSDTLGSVCPQRLPDIGNETAALQRMPRGRLLQLRRLLPLLRNQSEDCLYLNIYAPLRPLRAAARPDAAHRHPVMVFVHGESYEWNSGNHYDGSVLAGYHGVVVVTINYRLGILGFLNANPAPELKARVANYGLMDQIAALHWVQQNIAVFGGDPGNVTLFGHDTGAACIHFLMTSPTVMPGLFHRAILLSGSSLSSWALVQDPVSYAVRLARHVNCSVPEDMHLQHETIVDCLREVPLQLLLAADVTAPAFLPAFGPSVDGVVVVRPVDLRGALLGRGYHLLFGVVTAEALFRFSASDLQAGFEGGRRDRILRTYVRNVYSYHLQEIYSAVVNEYTDWERTVLHPVNTRDSTAAALGDAEYVAPLVLAGDMHSYRTRPTSSCRSYFYVFDYQSRDSDYPQRMGMVHGEELPYVFGAPLVEGVGHFPRNYTKYEMGLSEAVMLYFSNFARTGNPNIPTKQEAINPLSKERNRFRNIIWEEYDNVHQKYLEISVKPRMKNHFRAHQLSVWLRLIPELHRAGMENMASRHNMFHNHEDDSLYYGMTREDTQPRRYSTDPGAAHSVRPRPSNRTSGQEATCPPSQLPPTQRQLQRGNSTNSTARRPAGYLIYSTALGVTIAIGCSLLVLNILIFAGVYYRRDRTRIVEVKASRQPPGNTLHLARHSDGSSIILEVECDEAPVMPTRGDGFFCTAKQRHASKATNLVNKLSDIVSHQEDVTTALENARNAMRVNSYSCSANGTATVPLAERHQPQSPESGSPKPRSVLAAPTAAVDEARVW